MRVLVPSLVGTLAVAALLNAQETPSPTPTPEGATARPPVLGFGQTGTTAHSLSDLAARIRLKKLSQDEIKEMFRAAATAPVPSTEASGSTAETKDHETPEVQVASAPIPARPISAPDQADYDFKLETLDGRPFDAHTLQGKVVLLNFWATWCGPCRAEMPSIQRFYERAGSAGVSVVALSDEKPETIAAFLQKNPYSFPIYRIIGRRPEVYRSTGIPVTFVLTPDGRIASKHVGSRGWEDGSILDSLKKVARLPA